MAEQPKKCKGTARFRNAVITSFNTDVSLVGVWQSNQDKISYLIGQKEICPSSGREHWQVYVEFKDRVRLSVIQGASMFDAKCHIEVRKGTSKEASDYCKKDASRAPGQEPPVIMSLVSYLLKASGAILRVYVTLLRPVHLLLRCWTITLTWRPSILPT